MVESINTNIAFGTSENTRVVIDHGVIPIFIKLLEFPSDDVHEQAVWALGNVAGDSPKGLDVVLNHGVLMPLLAQFNDLTKLSMLRNVTWMLSDSCRGNPPPAFDQTKLSILALGRLIHSNDEEVLIDACWALSYLLDGTDDKIQVVIDTGVYPRLIELLLHPSPNTFAYMTVRQGASEDVTRSIPKFLQRTKVYWGERAFDELVGMLGLVFHWVENAFTNRASYRILLGNGW
ncbi:hypothetical protein F2P56_012732 [Juglans regia]|uniref:Importin subunit alpha-1-like n=1 Tax=Juglans regia TaxID=51240 RepID=A0A833XMX3_JUGRE|nr:hypothetical protein F2P56_012732 [Juglans regia]